MYIFIALITGVLVIGSMIVNSRLGDRIGLFQGVLVNYTVGLFFAILFLLFNLNSVTLTPQVITNIPIWAYLGGVLGFIIVAISNIIIPKIPTIYTTLLIFMGQLFTGIIIDSLGGNIISKGKVIGGILIFFGLLYNLRIDKKYSQL